MAGLTTGALAASLLVVTQAVAPPVAHAAPVSYPSSEPDQHSAKIAARLSGHDVVVDELTTATSRTWAKPDGTMSAEFSAGIARVRQGNGWADIDTTLSTVGGRVVPAVTATRYSFSAGGGGPLVIWSDAAGHGLSLGWPTGLPAPSLQGNVATYVDARPGVDVLLTALSTGFEVSLRLTHRPAAGWTQSLPWSLAGMSARGSGAAVAFQGPNGDTVLSSPPPTMWDASIDPTTGLSAHTGQVALSVDNSSGLQLAPDDAFLSDPSTVYPVVIDPQYVIPGTTSAYVEYPTNRGSAFYQPSQLYLGNDGYNLFRSFLFFQNWAQVRDKHILDAKLQLWETYSSTCANNSTNEQVDLYSLGSAWTYQTTWDTQPAWSIKQGSAIFAHGQSGCAAAYDNVPATGAVARWANYSDSTGEIGLRAYNEGTTYSYKRFNTPTTGNGGIPTMYVTYNTPPGQASGQAITPCAGCTSPALTASQTPTLKASATDADSDTLRMDYEVWAGNSGTPTSQVTSGSVSGVASGATASWTVAPALADATYEYRARAYDGHDYGPWSGWFVFTVDHTAPAAPSVTSSTWAKNVWAPTSATTGTLAWSSDGTQSSFQYSMDSAGWTGTTATSASLTVAQGWHTFHVRAQDSAGNTSQTDYPFGVGDGTLSSPADQDRSQDSVTVRATPSDASLGYVQYQYALGNQATFNPATAWQEIPNGSLKVPGQGTTLPTRQGNGTYLLTTYPSLTWTAVNQLTDGLLQVRACFYTDATTTNASACTALHNLQTVRSTFGASYATRDLGPGKVSLLTGDFAVSATDVSLPTYAGGLTVSRTATTLAPAPASTTAAGAVGPGWTLALPDPGTGRTDEQLTDDGTDGYLLLTGPDGAEEVFATTAGPTAPRSYTPLGDATDGTTITENPLHTFTATDPDGTRTTWVSGGSTLPAHAASVTLPGSGQPGGTPSPSYTFDPQTGLLSSVSQGPPGVTCTSPSTLGCRSLVFVYNAPNSFPAHPEYAMTGPAGTTSTVSGRLVEIDAVVTVYDTTVSPPALTTTTTPVMRYSYDSTNTTTARLVAAWDPRVSPALVTGYGYVGTSNRLQTVTPAGLNPWTLGFENTSGRLATVRRHDDALNADAVSTVAYGLPWSGTSATSVGLKDMTKDQTSLWGQSTDLVANAAAVFSPDPGHPVPLNSDGAAVPTGAEWPFGQLSYLDVNGREVDTANFGGGDWRIANTNYDNHGNVVSSLSADNRDQALTPTAATDPAVANMTTSQARAQALQTQNIYSTDGIDLLQVLGPMHPVSLSGGTTVDARSHTVYRYDNGSEAGHPAGGPLHLVVSTTTSAQTADLADHDSHVVTKGYATLVSTDGSGWTLRQPTSVSVVQSDGSTSTHWTRFDPTGRVIETRLPAGTADASGVGNDAHSTVTSYYGTASSGSCQNLAWAGLVCTTGQPANTLPARPTSTVTGYNGWDEPTASTETDSSGTLLRSASTSYDAAGRPVTTSSATTTGVTGGGTSTSAVPAVTTGYDPYTGLVHTLTSTPGTLTSDYDSQGRLVRYTDASGNVSTTSYDLAGRVATRSDGKGTYTYTYDGLTGEHRGLLTGLNTGITAAGYSSNTSYAVTRFDGDGRPLATTLPNGDIATAGFDNAGEQTSLAYTGTGLGTGGLTFRAAYDSVGRKTTMIGPVNNATFSYTETGELATATRTDVGTGVCTSQAYGYDADSNRTGYGSTAAASCTAATVPTVHTYDPGDRLIDAGVGYDQLGRTTTAPAATVTGGADLAVAYFDNDMVQQQSQTVNGVTHTQTFTLDPSGHRVLSQNDSSAGVSTNFYADGGDSPAWTSSPTGWTRNIDGLNGLGAIETYTSGTSPTDSVSLQLTDLTGNVVATVDDTTGAVVGPLSDYDPFGASVGTAPAPARYGWLGRQQRAADDLGGLVLMGYRLYNPSLGRFLQTDPIVGGNANPYDYCTQDPINCYDLDGRWGFKKWWKHHWKDVVHTAVGVAVTSLSVAAAAGLCATGVGCVVVVGAALSVSYGVAAQLGTAAALHERVTTRKVVGWMAGSAFAGGRNGYTVGRYGATPAKLAGRWAWGRLRRLLD